MDNIIDILYNNFMQQYSFVCINKEVVKQFYERFKSDNVHMLLDYVISNGLEEDIEL